ncbi:MAG: hypothetical protein QM741_09365 [Rudaea sp.]|uniref:hypothetical protein n=1 Tax=Rudaea sp. TaxID=2136325 RepID=UPI0039E5FB1F
MAALRIASGGQRPVVEHALRPMLQSQSKPALARHSGDEARRNAHEHSRSEWPEGASGRMPRVKPESSDYQALWNALKKKAKDTGFRLSPE